MGFVTGQLVQPYKDRPNEGSLAIYTEFSPMADPSFEAGRPGESAVEVGRIIDRGLRLVSVFFLPSILHSVDAFVSSLYSWAFFKVFHFIYLFVYLWPCGD